MSFYSKSVQSIGDPKIGVLLAPEQFWNKFTGSLQVGEVQDEQSINTTVLIEVLGSSKTVHRHFLTVLEGPFKGYVRYAYSHETRELTCLKQLARIAE